MIESEDHILLDSEELSLIKTKHTGNNQLIFAVMLKFRQVEGCYPTVKDAISPYWVSTLAKQLDIESLKPENFDWQHRSIRRFRHEIRKFLTYKVSTREHIEPLIAYLIQNASIKSMNLIGCRAIAYQFFSEHKLEPFKPPLLDGYITKANHRFEKQLFDNIINALSVDTVAIIDELLQSDKSETDQDQEEDKDLEEVDQTSKKRINFLKKDMGGVKLKHVQSEIDKLLFIRSIDIPKDIFDQCSRKLLQKYYARTMALAPSNIREYIPNNRYAMMSIFCYTRSQILTDNLADFLLLLIHRMRTSSEISVNKQIISEVKCINGKFDILHSLADITASNPEGIIQNKVYPKVSQETLQNLVKELESRGRWYQRQVQTKIHSLYSHGSRVNILKLIDAFDFNSANESSKGLLEAILFIKQNRDLTAEYYPVSTIVPMHGAISSEWKAMVIEKCSKTSLEKIKRINYEIAVLEELRKALRCKLIWIKDSYRYRDPCRDLPQDFDERKEYYYTLLDLPLCAKEFTKKLRKSLENNLKELNDTILNNPKVKIIAGKNATDSRIKLTPYEAQSEPINLKILQQAIDKRFSSINLIDILKETDFRVNFTEEFHTVANKQAIRPEHLLKRLLLCLYAIGSNTGLKRVGAANDDATYSDLRYIKKRFINDANVRSAIAKVIDAIIDVRDPNIWGSATTGCASDSTKVSSWDQNLMVEWHIRYNGRGVMIYWHVDGNSACIHSQLKTCSSSEVGSMIKGVLSHCSKMNLKQNYVDTHGQSTIGFGFSYLLNFDLMPRLKNLNKQKLYYPSNSQKNDYLNLKDILHSSINWTLIENGYNEAVKYTAALKTGNVEPDVIIKHLSKDNYDHPVYKTLTEIGHAVKTIFLCKYLSSEELRIEIHEALNIIERLNSIMGFIFYGKLGEIRSNNKDEQELSVACLHLLQVCMVYINTLIIQEVLSDKSLKDRLTPEDKRALSPLIHSHINPYGLFPLDLTERIIIEIQKVREAA